MIVQFVKKEIYEGVFNIDLPLTEDQVHKMNNAQLVEYIANYIEENNREEYMASFYGERTLTEISDIKTII